MKSKTVILLVVAGVCGLVASYMTSRYLASQNEKVTVLVAKQKIAGYTQLKEVEQLFDLEERPRNEVPKDAVVSVDAAKDQVVSRTLERGDILAQGNIVDKNKLGIEVSIPPGFRAVGVRTTQEAVVGGFVLPGSHVDVIHTARGGNKDEVKGQMILQNILVLAVDQLDNRQEGRNAVVSTTVSLLVTPEEATVLASAQNTGIITFSLRSKQDDGTVATAEKPKAKEPEPEPQTEPKPEVKDPEQKVVGSKHTLTIINGQAVTKAQFDGEAPPTIERTGPEPASRSSLPPAPPAAKDNEAGSK